MPSGLCRFTFIFETANPASYKISVGSFERKRLLERPGCRYEDNKTELNEVVCNDVDWLHLMQDGAQIWPVVNDGLESRVPKGRDLSDQRSDS
jgi:hypothetical protein